MAGGGPKLNPKVGATCRLGEWETHSTLISQSWCFWKSQNLQENYTDLHQNLIISMRNRCMGVGAMQDHRTYPWKGFPNFVTHPDIRYAREEQDHLLWKQYPHDFDFQILDHWFYLTTVVECHLLHQRWDNESSLASCGAMCRRAPQIHRQAPLLRVHDEGSPLHLPIITPRINTLRHHDAAPLLLLIDYPLTS